MRTLFLQAPSFEGFDGGAGSRYQARREIRSFWYPTWLAQPAALVENSKLIDAPPHRTRLSQVVEIARSYDLAVLHTSAPSFAADIETIKALKAANAGLKVGLVGAKVAVDPAGSLQASPLIDFVARNEFDFTIKEVADERPWSEIAGLSYRNGSGVVVHNDERAILENMDRLPFVTPVYKRDLDIDNYFIGYLKHPYLSIYTGRGCKSRCTFCLWPQTVGGHRYRTRSVGHVIEEIAWAQKAFPQVKEFFFDDDTFTDDLPRAEAIAKELRKLGVTWSCNAKANVPRKTLQVLRDNGLRLLLVGYESGNQQILHNIKKGMRIDVSRQFTKDCRELGITIHGTFIMGLPGETKETIEETIRYATEINPHTIQVSLAAPYPGTFLYNQAMKNGWLDGSNAELVNEDGVQIAPLHYPHLSHTEIFELGRGILSPVLFPLGQDCVHRRRDGQKSADDEAPAARGRRILSVPARAAGRGALKALIVTADDFGLAPEVNEAVETAHRNGILTAASLMVGAPAAADALNRARRLPSLRVGLHIVLIDGHPVSPPGQVPALVDGSGRFRNDMGAASVRIFFDPAVRRQVAAEIAAQFEAFAATGLPLDHVDCHKHWHLHPTIAGLVLKIGRRYGMTALRVPSEPMRVLRLVESVSPLPQSFATAAAAARLRARVRRHDLRAADRVFGLAWSGAMTEQRVAGLLAHLPDGLTEIYTHPATSNSFPGAVPGYRYADEFAALVAPRVSAATKAAGIRLTGYSDLAEASGAITQ